LARHGSEQRRGKMQSDGMACGALDSRLHSGKAFRALVFADSLRASMFRRLRRSVRCSTVSSHATLAVPVGLQAPLYLAGHDESFPGWAGLGRGDQAKARTADAGPATGQERTATRN
jgi:hypothetical protein